MHMDSDFQLDHDSAAVETQEAPPTRRSKKRSSSTASGNKPERVSSRVTIYLRDQNWWARYSQDGKQQRVSLKTNSKKQARKLAERIAAQLVLGTLPAPASKGHSIAEVLEKFKANKDLAGMKASTLKLIRHDGDQLVQFLTSRGINCTDQWRPSDLQDFQQVLRTTGFFDYPGSPRQKKSRKKSPCSTSSLYRKVLTAKELSRYAFEYKLAPTDAFAAVKLPHRRHVERACFTSDQIAKVLKAAPAHLKVVIRFLLLTGLRLGELCWLTKDDIDLNRRIIHVRRKPGWEPKGKRQREVPIHNESLLDLVQQAMKNSAGPWLFEQPPRKGVRGRKEASTRYLEKTLGAAIKKVIKAAGVPGSAHSTRHTFATESARRGVPVLDLQKILGHRNVSTTMGYYHQGDLSGRTDLKSLNLDYLPPDDVPAIKENK